MEMKVNTKTISTPLNSIWKKTSDQVVMDRRPVCRFWGRLVPAAIQTITPKQLNKMKIKNSFKFDYIFQL
jgi:hypothetical protein